jgi:hypothetical protein
MYKMPASNFMFAKIVIVEYDIVREWDRDSLG